MKIIHFVMGKANPHRQNGINKVVHNLALSHHRQGLDVEVWGITDNIYNNDLPREYVLRLFRPGGHRFSLQADLKQAIKQLPGNTIFHFHGVLLPEFCTTAHYLKQLGISWIVTPHGAYNQESLEKNTFLKTWFFRLFDKKFISEALALHAHSTGEISALQEKVSIQNLVLLPNGQNIEEVTFEHAPIETPSRPVFGFCGRLAMRHKGLDLLLQGFAAYKHQSGSGILWLIGDGDDRQELINLAQELGIREFVRFCGPLFGQEKLNRIAHMDAFIHTSRWEGMPMAVLEAAALKRPLLVSEGTNLGSHVSRWGCGIVLEDNTPPIIAAALLELENRHNQQTLSQDGDRAFDMITEAFSWDHIARQLSEQAYSLGVSIK